MRKASQEATKEDNDFGEQDDEQGPGIGVVVSCTRKRDRLLGTKRKRDSLFGTKNKSLYRS